MFKVSPSQIGMLLQCPRCLWLHYREEGKRPEGIFPRLPSGMDGVFKVYFDFYRKRGKLPPEIDGRIEGKLFDDAKKLHVWQNNRVGLSFEFPELFLLLKGAIDDLVVTPEGMYAPFDFKTRGYPNKEDTHHHYQTQLNLYALLFEKNNLPSANVGYLLFFWPEKYERGNTIFSSRLVKIMVSAREGYRILQKVHQIITGEMPLAHSECQYCQYRDGQPND